MKEREKFVSFIGKAERPLETMTVCEIMLKTIIFDKKTN